MEACLEVAGALEIRGRWGDDQVKCSVVNVYMSCVRGERYAIFDTWKLVFSAYSDGILCFVGDFNTVRHPSEIRGRDMETPWSECSRFEDFISVCGLEELNLSGRKYTWYKDDGSPMSKIDRILLNDVGMAKWNSGALSALTRSLSDHCALVLKNQVINWGPKPFKMNNGWFLKKNFSGFVEEKWKKYVVKGKEGYILKEKMKLLKSDLREWGRKYDDENKER